MTNICDTSYKVRGPRNVVNYLLNTLPSIEVNSKNEYLYQLTEHYGIDYGKKDISIISRLYFKYILFHALI